MTEYHLFEVGIETKFEKKYVVASDIYQAIGKVDEEYTSEVTHAVRKKKNVMVGIDW